MDASVPYVVVAVAVLLAIGMALFLAARRHADYRLTPLAGIAFALIIAGVIFGEPHIAAYTLMGVGVVLSFVDIYRRARTL